MEPEKAPGTRGAAYPGPPAEDPDGPPGGCLAVAVRVPVRIVALVLVLPVRMAWDALAVAAHFVHRNALRPVGRGLARLWQVLVVVPLTAVLRALGWLGRTLAVTPLLLLYRHVLTPLGRALAGLLRAAGTGLAWVLRGSAACLGWLARVLVLVPAAWLYRWVLTPLGHGVAVLLRGLGAGAGWLARVLAVLPAAWLYRNLLTPLGHGLAWLAGWLAAGLAWLAPLILVRPWAALWRHALVPAGKALALLGYVLVVVPATALWRWVLAPVGRALAVVASETAAALAHAWRIAGHLSLAAGRLLARVLRWVFVDPVRWAYRTLATPLGHVVRDLVLRPVAAAVREAGHAVREALAGARDGVRRARADLRRTLFGAPPRAVPPPRTEPRREPEPAPARTLGSSTTALTKD